MTFSSKDIRSLIDQIDTIDNVDLQLLLMAVECELDLRTLEGEEMQELEDIDGLLDELDDMLDEEEKKPPESKL